MDGGNGIAGVAFAIPLLWRVSNAIPHPESYILTYINGSAGLLFLRQSVHEISVTIGLSQINLIIPPNYIDVHVFIVHLVYARYIYNFIHMYMYTSH